MRRFFRFLHIFFIYALKTATRLRFKMCRALVPEILTTASPVLRAAHPAACVAAHVREKTTL